MGRDFIFGQSMAQNILLSRESVLFVGAVVEWLEQLCYGAESGLEVVSSMLEFVLRRLENSLC